MLTNPVFKKIALSFIWLGMFSMMLMTVGCSENSDNLIANSNTDEIVDIENTESYDGEFTTLRFSESLSLVQLKKITQDHNLKIEEIRIDFGEFISGYTLAGRDIGTIVDDFNEEHQKMLNVMKTNSDNDKFIEIASKASGSLKDFKISAVSFRVSPENLSDIGYGSVIDSNLLVLPLNRTLDDDDTEYSSKDSIVSTSTSTRHESWSAYTGWSAVTQNYSYQSFRFDNLIAYIGISTYEHETQIYDKNFANYSGYWASNLPRPYKDTPFLDNIDNFTVGSAYADALVAHHNYWTYMSLRPQSSKTALCKIRGQIGYRFPSWCYSTWCIYALATTAPGCYAYLALPDYGVTWHY